MRRNGDRLRCGVQIISISIATPIPPETQSVASPRWPDERWPLLQRSSCNSVVVMRAPVQPMG